MMVVNLFVVKLIFFGLIILDGGNAVKTITPTIHDMDDDYGETQTNSYNDEHFRNQPELNYQNNNGDDPELQDTNHYGPENKSDYLPTATDNYQEPDIQRGFMPMSHGFKPTQIRSFMSIKNTGEHRSPTSGYPEQRYSMSGSGYGGNQIGTYDSSRGSQPGGYRGRFPQNGYSRPVGNTPRGYGGSRGSSGNSQVGDGQPQRNQQGQTGGNQQNEYNGKQPGGYNQQGRNPQNNYAGYPGNNLQGMNGKPWETSGTPVAMGVNQNSRYPKGNQHGAGIQNSLTGSNQQNRYPVGDQKSEYSGQNQQNGYPGGNQNSGSSGQNQQEEGMKNIYSGGNHQNAYPGGNQQDPHNGSSDLNGNQIGNQRTQPNGKQQGLSNTSGNQKNDDKQSHDSPSGNAHQGGNQHASTGGTKPGLLNLSGRDHEIGSPIDSGGLGSLGYPGRQGVGLSGIKQGELGAQGRLGGIEMKGGLGEEGEHGMTGGLGEAIKTQGNLGREGGIGMTGGGFRIQGGSNVERGPSGTQTGVDTRFHRSEGIGSELGRQEGVGNRGVPSMSSDLKGNLSKLKGENFLPNNPQIGYPGGGFGRPRGFGNQQPGSGYSPLNKQNRGNPPFANNPFIGHGTPFANKARQIGNSRPLYPNHLRTGFTSPVSGSILPQGYGDLSK